MLVNKEKSRIWEQSGVEGILISVVWNNPNGDGAYFANFKAGAYFPLHSHEGWEQIFVISGMIQFGQITLSKGDSLKVDLNDEHDATALEETTLFIAHRGGINLK